MVKSGRQVVQIHAAVAEQIGDMTDSRRLLRKASAPGVGDQHPDGAHHAADLAGVLRGEADQARLRLVRIRQECRALTVVFAFKKTVVPVDADAVVQQPQIVPHPVGGVAGERPAEPVDAVVNAASLSLPAGQIAANVRILFENFAVHAGHLSVNSGGKPGYSAADDQCFQKNHPF